MLSIRNQLICLSIAMLLMISFQPDQVNGQMKKKKAILKGLMGASLLKLLKPKKGVLPIPLPLPLPLPIDWHQQAGLLSKNNPPTHVSHQPYASQGYQMSPIEYSEYQNAISQALSNSNSYIPSSYSSGSSSSSGSAYSNAGNGQTESGYSAGGSSASNGYDGNAGSNDDSSSSSSYGQSNGGATSYGVAGVGQNDEYNAYQVSNGDNNGGSSGGYRAAASSLNPNYNVHFNNPQSSYSYGSYAPNYNQFNNAQQEYSQPAPNNEQQSQFNYQNGPVNQQSNYEDNSGSASSQSYIATTNQQQQNNYIPLRSVQPIYHQLQQSTYQQQQQQQQSQQQQSTGQQQPNYASNGWVALD